MSITFSPAGNHEYCRANELTSKQTVPCLRCDDGSGTIDPSCFYCSGKGTVDLYYEPYELNIANTNAYALLDRLGLKVDPAGAAHPQAVLDGINLIRSQIASGSNPLTSENEVWNEGAGKARVFVIGRTEQQVGRYLDVLSEIAIEAIRRGVPLVWG